MEGLRNRNDKARSAASIESHLAAKAQGTAFQIAARDRTDNWPEL